MKRGLRICNGGKKVNSRKRHILADTEGLLLKVQRHEAGMSDSAGRQDGYGMSGQSISEDAEGGDENRHWVVESTFASLIRRRRTAFRSQDAWQTCKHRPDWRQLIK